MGQSKHSITWLSAGLTHKGKVRELNEDAMLERPAEGVWAVADGMGGHHAGDLASRSVAKAMGRVSGSALSSLIEASKAELTAVNAKLYERGLRKQARIIGSTVVVLLTHGAQVAVVWAGDSRAYRLPANATALEPLTQDHSRVSELIAQGELTPELAESHPEANVITRAIGVAADVELDVRLFDVEPHDTLLLCSDGLSRYVSEDEMAQLLMLPSCSQAVEQLLQRALQSPARDNITAVVVRGLAADEATQTVLNPRESDAEPGIDDDPTVLDTP